MHTSAGTISNLPSVRIIAKGPNERIKNKETWQPSVSPVCYRMQCSE
jgi:hypothetical protein